MVSLSKYLSETKSKPLKKKFNSQFSSESESLKRVSDYVHEQELSLSPQIEEITLK